MRGAFHLLEGAGMAFGLLRRFQGTPLVRRETGKAGVEYVLISLKGGLKGVESVLQP